MDPFVGLYVISLPLLIIGVIWVVTFVANDPTREICQTKRHHFLGPGGPDDPFAEDPYVD